MRYTFDESGSVCGYSTSTDGTTWTAYYYVKNIQGDVIEVFRASDNTSVATFKYDSWGFVLSAKGTNATENPFRYRGYYYDVESKFYYLQSRYYDPELGRFLNPDSLVSTGQGILGNNMFAYCNNNPVNYIDTDGESAEVLQWWSGTMWWLCGADTALPVGDIIYIGGILLLGAVVLASDQDNVPEISYDKADVAYDPPSPNNNDDDDDDNDDYYDDDSNFGGRKKIGKGKGKTPGNNQRQNKQFNDATKRILNKDQQRALHNEISGEGFGFHEIADAAKNLWFLFIGLFAADD